MNIHGLSFHLLFIILDRILASISGNTITPPVPVKPTTKAIPVREDQALFLVAFLN